MKHNESLFILQSKNNRKPIYLRQQKNGTYYFSKAPKENPKKWLLKNIYIENEEVTMHFVGAGHSQQRNITVLSNEKFERVFYFIEPSKFAPFPHDAKIFDTVKMIERLEQEGRIKEQQKSIYFLIGTIIFLTFLFIRLFVL